MKNSIIMQRSLELCFFTQHDNAALFLNEHKNIKELFLISDYELRGQITNGVSFILENDMRKNSMIITNLKNSIEPYAKIKYSGIDIVSETAPTPSEDLR